MSATLALLFTLGVAAQDARVDESSASEDASSATTDDAAAATDTRGTKTDKRKTTADTSEVKVTSPMTGSTSSTSSTSTKKRATDDALCAHTPELRVAVLHGMEATFPAAGIADELRHWGCVAVFALPTSVPMIGDSLPEGAAAVADRVGVDWIITVSPESTKALVAARLIEVSNLQVLGAGIGAPGKVAAALVDLVKADLAKAAADGARIAVVVEKATLSEMRALEADLKRIDGVKATGKARVVDGRGFVIAQFIGSAEDFAAVVDTRVVKGRTLEVTGVKLRRLDVKLGAAPASAAR